MFILSASNESSGYKSLIVNTLPIKVITEIDKLSMEASSHSNICEDAHVIEEATERESSSFCFFFVGFSKSIPLFERNSFLTEPSDLNTKSMEWMASSDLQRFSAKEMDVTSTSVITPSECIRPADVCIFDWGFSKGDWLKVDDGFGDGDPFPDCVVEGVEDANVMRNNK